MAKNKKQTTTTEEPATLLRAAELVLARIDHTNIHTTLADMHDTWEMLRKAIKQADEPTRTHEEKYYFEEAKLLQRDGELEIDDDAVVSLSEDPDYDSGHRGAYVQAWVWIDNPEDPKA